MFFEIGIGKVGEITDDNVWILDGRLDEGHGFHIRNWVDYVGIGVFWHG